MQGAMLTHYSLVASAAGSTTTTKFFPSDVYVKPENPYCLFCVRSILVYNLFVNMTFCRQLILSFSIYLCNVHQSPEYFPFFSFFLGCSNFFLWLILCILCQQEQAYFVFTTGTHLWKNEYVGCATPWCWCWLLPRGKILVHCYFLMKLVWHFVSDIIIRLVTAVNSHVTFKKWFTSLLWEILYM